MEVRVRDISVELRLNGAKHSLVTALFAGGMVLLAESWETL